MNLVLALVFARIAGDYVLAGANLLLGVFNLLPVPSLDGGRALFLLVSWGADPGTADQLCRRVGLGCALGLTALALALTLWHGAGLFLLLGALGTLLPQLPRRRRGRDGRSFSKKDPPCVKARVPLFKNGKEGPFDSKHTETAERLLLLLPRFLASAYEVFARNE